MFCRQILYCLSHQGNPFGTPLIVLFGGTVLQEMSLHLFAWLSCKNLPAMQETRVRSLDWEDPLEKGMATHSSIIV